MLIKREKTVAAYLFLLRFKFLSASSPSKPNSHLVNLEVLSFLPLILISVIRRIASMGDIREARFAGKKADSIMIIAVNNTVTIITIGDITSRKDTLAEARES